MNIFEYLGLPANHREESKVTQAVKHFDEVSDKYRSAKTYSGQIKKDGVSSLTVIRGVTARIFSRTGKKLTNVGRLENDITQLCLEDGIYLGELCCPCISLEVLSGTVNPNRVNSLRPELEYVRDKLEMHWFDYVPIEDFIEGESPLTFLKRYALLVSSVRDKLQQYPNVNLVPLRYEINPENFAKEAIANGEEGVVIRPLNGNWEAGHKGWRAMKIVRGVSYDLRCIGYEEGKGKYKGKIANLIFKWKDGKTIKGMLGKGWSHDDAMEMFCCADDKDLSGSPVGEIFQVYALEESSQGKLRLPKVGERRHDKSESDV